MRYSRIIVSALLAGVLVSCGGNAGKEKTIGDEAAEKMEFESYSYDVIAQLPDSDSIPDAEGWKYCRVTGEGMMPVMIGGKDIAVLRDTLERLGSVTFASEKECGPRLGDGMSPTALSPDSVSACSETNNQLSIVMMTPRVVVWQEFMSAYRCRAAHGVYKTSFLNYDPVAGKVIGLADLMEPGYEKTLTEMIRQKLTADGVDLLEPVDEVGIPSQFRITSRGLRFLYGIYEIAPYAAGEIAVDFDSYELQEILRPASLKFWNLGD